MTEPEAEYRSQVESAVGGEGFLRLTLSRPPRPGASPWEKVGVRPVRVGGVRCLQFSYFDGRKVLAKNYAGEEALQKLREALDLPLSQVHLQSAGGDLHVRITRKGRALVAQGRPSLPDRQPDLEHNRPKHYLLAGRDSVELLQAVGIMNAKGRVRPSMQDKFRQVNEFLRIVDQVLPEEAADRPVRIVDCGCGRAYLTFAACHHLKVGRGLGVRVTGIDVDAAVIETCNRLRDRLGWTELDFQAARIADFSPPEPPDIVLSLHACDTATDEAIARGVQWGSRAILAAPCCQHELHEKLQAPAFQPVLRHGILRQRLADILTDAFRALVLRILGYRADVVEFVSPEATSKNLLLRAERAGPPGHAASVRQYEQLKEFWSVTPALEGLLGERLRRFLRA